MNKTAFAIVVEEEGLEGSRIQDSTVYLSQKKAIEIRNDLIRSIFDEQYAECDGRLEINTPDTAPETAWISVNGTWVETATIEAVEIDDEAE